MSNFDSLKLSVEALSGGKNTVVLDDLGMPSIMVRIPKFNLSDVIDGAPNTTHPAFIVDGVVKDEILISKFQNIVVNDRAYSLPMKDPRTYANFDQAVQYCKNKGAGWHLMTNAEWAALALWCKKNGYMPRGNNSYGKDASAPHEKGVVTYKYTSNDIQYDGRVATGSGSAAWAHDDTNEGIFDLNGNVWEWTAGLRLKNGEIQIVKDNDAAMANADFGDSSSWWKGILQDGNLAAPGTASTLKIDNTTPGTADKDGNNVGGDPIINITRDNPIYTGGDVNDHYRYSHCNFETLAAKSGVTVPTLLKALGVFPVDGNCGTDGLWIRNYGERMPLRGGSWWDGSGAGVFALSLNDPRTSSYPLCGVPLRFLCSVIWLLCSDCAAIAAFIYHIEDGYNVTKSVAIKRFMIEFH